MRPLYPHQEEAIARLRRSLGSGKRRPMIQAATGFGKTILAAAVVEGALAKGNRVTFVVPALSLIDQTVDRFWSEGIRDIGVIQGRHELTNGLRPVQVASVQTLQRRYLPPSEIVVIDEAHRWFQFYGEWMAMDEWRDIPFVGLSASPWTKGLGKHYDDLIVTATTADLIKAGYLSPFRVFAPSHPDLSGVRTVAGDYHEGDLSEAMDKPKLTADVVETWRANGEDRPTLCFAVDRAHAKHLQTEFEQAGIPTGYIDAYTDMEDREGIRRRFESGDLKVVCNVGCLTMGVDWDVRCIVLARPTKSEMLFTQIIGRGLRTAEGKADCLILDHSDTHLRLGYVTDIRHDRLHDGKPTQRSDRAVEALPKPCPSCSFLRPPKTHACPACGFEPERKSEIVSADGKLVELGKSQRRHNRQDDRTAKVAFIRQLKAFAIERGRSKGWVSNAYRERYGVWPN
ncbi:MAG: DEAD/DEAH box helicase, partial [bacterium]|nr:DEAD/DEAH box helicase [bacterium]